MKHILGMLVFPMNFAKEKSVMRVEGLNLLLLQFSDEI